MGFCAGVQVAVRKVYDAVESGRLSGRPVYTIGPLIHNEMFLEKLRDEEGVKVISSPEGNPPGIAVIRAHGIPGHERDAFKNAGFELVDGTCRRVMRSQQLVSKSAKEGKQILIVGNPEHGEVKAILGEAEGYPYIRVIQGADDFEEGIRLDMETILLSQTTFSAEQYWSTADTLLNLFRESPQNAGLEVLDTICPATTLRQEALRKLTAAADAVLVIGGKQSANTRRLYEMVREAGKPAWHISADSELCSEIFAYQTIGITAGASTPEWLIDQITEQLKKGLRQ
jgi:4-hydroxy-3-methylbut-2-en-1-yl diphosphate reductase